MISESDIYIAARIMIREYGGVALAKSKARQICSGTLATTRGRRAGCGSRGLSRSCARWSRQRPTKPI